MHERLIVAETADLHKNCGIFLTIPFVKSFSSDNMRREKLSYRKRFEAVVNNGDKTKRLLYLIIVMHFVHLGDGEAARGIPTLELGGSA